MTGLRPGEAAGLIVIAVIAAIVLIFAAGVGTVAWLVLS